VNLSFRKKTRFDLKAKRRVRLLSLKGVLLSRSGKKKKNNNGGKGKKKGKKKQGGWGKRKGLAREDTVGAGGKTLSFLIGED